MYTAELFNMATDPETSRAAFLNNVTLSICLLYTSDAADD